MDNASRISIKKNQTDNFSQMTEHLNNHRCIIKFGTAWKISTDAYWIRATINPQRQILSMWLFNDVKMSNCSMKSKKIGFLIMSHHLQMNSACHVGLKGEVGAFFFPTLNQTTRQNNKQEICKFPKIMLSFGEIVNHKKKLLNPCYLIHF